MKTRKRINPISKWMAKAKAIYRKIAAEYLKTHTRCVVTGRKSNQVHHTRGKLGTLLIDRRFFLPVDDQGQRTIHDNIAWARGKGLICAKGLWNTPPKDAETERLKNLLITPSAMQSHNAEAMRPARKETTK